MEDKSEEPYNSTAAYNLLQNLISEVQKRPTLWNKYDYLYNNRAHMDAEWTSVAAQLNKDKDFIKQRWRNLRDQFHREAKKVKVPPNKPNINLMKYYRGKWVHFEAMLFLINSITTKRTIDPGDSNDEGQETINIPLELVDVNQETYDPNDGAETTNAVDNLVFEIKEEVIDPDYREVNFQAYKRQPSEANISEPDTRNPPKLAKKSSKSENTTVNDNDEDMYFLKSLVPYFKKMNPIRKLIVRNEIQNLLLRESLCDNCKFGGQSSCHSSS